MLLLLNTSLLLLLNADLPLINPSLLLLNTGLPLINASVKYRSASNKCFSSSVECRFASDKCFSSSVEHYHSFGWMPLLLSFKLVLSLVYCALSRTVWTITHGWVLLKICFLIHFGGQGMFSSFCWLEQISLPFVDQNRFLFLLLTRTDKATGYPIYTYYAGFFCILQRTKYL